MKTSALESSIHLVSALAFGLIACNDERLRELGNTASLPLETDPSWEETPPPCELDFISADAVQAEVAADLASLPSESRAFTRYLSLANRLNQGICPEQLSLDHGGASKLINGLSRQPDVVVPTVVGSGEGLLRVDLRAYGWSGPVVANGQTHADHWEALIAQSPMAIELGGEDGAAIVAQTGTRVPILSVDAFIAAATTAPLYYELLGVPGTLGELRQSVGLPSEIDPVAAGALRIATDKSRVLRQQGDLVAIDRYSTTVGAYFELFRVDTVAFLADPLRVQPAVERQIIFPLPNDLLGFAVTDAAGALSGHADMLDTNQLDSRTRVLDSCTNCHAQGFIPTVDAAEGAILSRPNLFSEEVVAAYRAAPSATESAAQFDADSDEFQRALVRATGTREGPDPIALRRFNLDIPLDLEFVAAELWVTPEQLESAIGELAPELLPLALGFGIALSELSSVYAAAFCSLHAGDENPPDAAFCARVP
jgi:hypothetical protein